MVCSEILLLCQLHCASSKSSFPLPVVIKIIVSLYVGLSGNPQDFRQTDYLWNAFFGVVFVYSCFTCLFARVLLFSLSTSMVEPDGFLEVLVP